jgi:hypothetical protein
MPWTPQDRWHLLRAWHVLVLGYHNHDQLQTVIEHAESAHAPSNSLYFDYASNEYITVDTMPTWRYEMFLVLLRKFENTLDMIH